MNPDAPDLVPVLSAEERESADRLQAYPYTDSPTTAGSIILKSLRLAAHPDTALAHKLLEVARERAALPHVHSDCNGKHSAEGLLREAARRLGGER
jgi:hypothetical protein